MGVIRILCFGYAPDAIKGFHEEKMMKKRKYTKLVHEGKYVAEVDIELIDASEGMVTIFSP